MSAEIWSHIEAVITGRTRKRMTVLEALLQEPLIFQDLGGIIYN